MAIYNKIQCRETIIGKLAHGGDVLEELTGVCVDNGIMLGTVTAIGAVKKACIGFYDQGSREYQFMDIDKELEITALVGNISVKDDKPMIHAHITLSDEKGNAFGGHLAPGTIVFACEFNITACDGAQLNRQFDEETGLPLWDMG